VSAYVDNNRNNEEESELLIAFGVVNGLLLIISGIIYTHLGAYHKASARNE